jgi:phage terminase large subunit GpA-like protein
VGTDTAKDNLFERLRVQNPGPGYIHFSKALPLEWFKGLTAEVRRTVRTSSGEKVRWVKTAARNEPLDTTVYAMFASQMLDHHKLSDAQWAKLENDLLPDLFALPLAAPEPGPAAPLAPGQIETRPAAPADAAAQAQPAQHAPPMAQRRRPPPPPPAPPPAPFVSPFASPEWSSRL